MGGLLVVFVWCFGLCRVGCLALLFLCVLCRFSRSFPSIAPSHKSCVAPLLSQ